MDIKEVDKIILQNFKSLGWELDGEITNIQELDVMEMAKLMIKCIFVIDADCDLPHSLPYNMAQRFRCAAKIAEIIKNLGYHGDLGYQSILYPNEVDLRKLFMFLIEKIPKDSPAMIKEPQGRSAVIEREARKKISDSLQKPWVPSYCMKVARKYRHLRSGSPPLTEYGIHHCHLFSTISNEVANEILLKNTVDQSKLLPSLLNSHAEQLGKELSSSELDKIMYIDKEKRGRFQGEDQYAKDFTLQTLVPAYKSYVNKLTVTQRNVKDSEIELSRTLTEDNEQKVSAMQNSESELHQKLEESVVKLNEVEKKIKNLHQLLEEERTNIGLEELKILSLKKTSSLATDVDANLTKLKLSLAAIKDKEEKLTNQWLEYKSPLASEFEHLKFEVDNKKNKRKELIHEISDLKQQMRALAIESSKKEAILHQLRQQQEYLPKGVNRSVYTKQILDISSKVRKQKQEIDKVLRDTRLIQKEINSLTGKLDRTFAVAEDASFKAATSNEKSRPIYRAVISIHEECGQLVEVIRETGSIQREMSDLEEQVNSEKSKTIEVNLKKLQEDLNKIKLENSVTKKRLNLTNGTDS